MHRWLCPKIWEGGARGVAGTLSMVRLTPSGEAEMLRLQQVGLDRFATFVADWEPARCAA